MLMKVRFRFLGVHSSHLDAGIKSSIHTHRHYIVIISPPFTPTAHSASATVRDFVARTTNAGESDITKVSIFDLENKYVAYTGTFPHGVRDVVSQWGKVYVLTNDGNVSSNPMLFIYLLTSWIVVHVPGKTNARQTRHSIPQVSVSHGAQSGQNARPGRNDRG